MQLLLLVRCYCYCYLSYSRAACGSLEGWRAWGERGVEVSRNFWGMKNTCEGKCS